MGEVTSTERIFEISSGAFEMAGAGESINVPIDPRINVAVLTADDPDPKYVNIETIRTGISKTNRRQYDSPVVHQINDMTVGLHAFLGHPDPAKTSFEFREPQGIFVGSTVQEMEDGITRAVAKMYMFKNSPLREWVPKSIVAGRPMTVSINGIGDVLRDPNRNVIHVKRMSQMDSIDWANPGTEGMGTSKALSVVNEMQDPNNPTNPTNKEGKQMSEPTRQDLVRGVSIAEMRAFNPDVVSQVIAGLSITELQASNSTLVDQIKESAKITEMQLTVDGKAGMVKLADIQGMMDAQASKITELQGEITTAKITEMRTRLVNEMVPEGYREQVAKRVVGSDEASIKKSIEGEVAFIKEIAGTNFDNPPRGNGAHKGGDDMAKAMRGLFGVKEPAQK